MTAAREPTVTDVTVAKRTGRDDRSVIRAELIEARCRIDIALAAIDGVPAELPRSAPWITTREAARQAGVTQECIRGWCTEFGIGEKIGGQWRCYQGLLDQHLLERSGR